ncbi:MAG: LytTR family transcriptional regulator [Actinobacteria bacterium]|nr:LytTR family transcriptional regulator [Actinomycetota bacterium]
MIKLVPLEEIVCFEAQRQYCYVHCREESILCSTHSLTELESILPSPPFLRVHRSYIVNMRKVVNIALVSPTKYELRMREGRVTRVAVPRRNVPDVKRFLGLSS